MVRRNSLAEQPLTSKQLITFGQMDIGQTIPGSPGDGEKRTPTTDAVTHTFSTCGSIQSKPAQGVEGKVAGFVAV